MVTTGVWVLILFVNCAFGTCSEDGTAPQLGPPEAFGDAAACHARVAALIDAEAKQAARPVMMLNPVCRYIEIR